MRMEGGNLTVLGTPRRDGRVGQGGVAPLALAHFLGEA